MPADYKTNLNDLLKASSCFWSCWKEEEMLAVALYLKIMELAGISTDYTGKTGLLTLQNDSKAWNSQVIDPSRRMGVALYLDQQAAIDNNAATAVTANDLKKAATCYSCIPYEQKKNLLLFLKWKLNTLDQP